jgi:putative DNA primase/helicase
MSASTAKAATASFWPEDLDMFARFLIPLELVAEAGIYRGTDGEIRARHHITWEPAKNVGGIVYSYFHPETGYLANVRVRRDHPEIDEDGKPQNKYICPSGNTQHLYFPPGARELLKDPQTVIVLVESEKAALAVTAWAMRLARKLVALAMGGCWSWRSQRARSWLAPNGEYQKIPGPIDDLKYLNNREVYILLDTNFTTNPDVQRACTELVVELNQRNCTLLVCELPQLEKVNGPDDFIAEYADHALADVFAGAYSPAHKSVNRPASPTAAWPKPNGHAPAPVNGAAQGATGSVGQEAVPDSDDALALLFSECHGKDLRYTAAWGQWSAWDETVWRKDTTLAIFDRARKINRGVAAACPSRARAGRLSSAQTVAAVERLARSDRRHAAISGQWDADPWLLSTPGGIVDLHTGNLRPAQREDYCTKRTAVAPDRGDTAPRWMEFLERVTAGDAALEGFLQRMAGYALTGITREHALFFLYGHGGNGKSTFIGTLAGVLGDYAHTAPVDTFLDSKNERHPTELAVLDGPRLVTAVETEEHRRWAESKLKNLTGGDSISARHMRQDFYTFTPVFKLVISGNHKPGLAAVDEAIRRRLHLVPFTVTIPPNERDSQLDQKLRAEWPGILQWAIEGCLEWQTSGLKPPSSVVAATEEYFATEDRMGTWLEENCMTSSQETAVKPLFEDWCAWCDRNRVPSRSLNWFVGAIELHGFKRRRTNTNRLIEGLILRNQFSPK